jgi:hypothetical protein
VSSLIKIKVKGKIPLQVYLLSCPPPIESVLGGGIEESGESYGRCSYGVVYLVHHTCITSLESKDSDH